MAFSHTYFIDDDINKFIKRQPCTLVAAAAGPFDLNQDFQNMMKNPMTEIFCNLIRIIQS